MGHPWKPISTLASLISEVYPSLTQDMTKTLFTHLAPESAFQSQYIPVLPYIFACYFPFTHQIHQESDMFGVSLLRFCRLIRLVRVVKVFRLRSSPGSFGRALGIVKTRLEAHHQLVNAWRLVMGLSFCFRNFNGILQRWRQVKDTY